MLAALRFVDCGWRNCMAGDRKTQQRGADTDMAQQFTRRVQHQNLNSFGSWAPWKTRTTLSLAGGGWMLSAGETSAAQVVSMPDDACACCTPSAERTDSDNR